MTKSVKRTDSEAQQEGKPDIAELVIKMQQQLVYLEKKIDALIAQSAARTVEEKQHTAPYQRHDQPPRQRDFRQNNDYRQRSLHKAVCADCGKECEVPFRPTGDRPVYCRDCFGKRKAASGPFNEKRDNKPERARPEHHARPARHDRGAGTRKGAMRKFGEKKLKYSKKRRKI